VSLNNTTEVANSIHQAFLKDGTKAKSGQVQVSVTNMMMFAMVDPVRMSHLTC
jgi:hypothetical protein